MQYEANHRLPAQLAVSMTPMIDVVFLLLIFFLCTATFQQPEEDLAASLLVPSEGQGAEDFLPELDEVLLEGNHTAGITTWHVNDGPTSYAAKELMALLRSLVEIDRGLPVTVEPRGEVPLGDVVEAYDAARQAGFHQVRLVAQQEGGR